MGKKVNKTLPIKSSLRFAEVAKWDPAPGSLFFIADVAALSIAPAQGGWLGKKESITYPHGSGVELEGAELERALRICEGGIILLVLCHLFSHLIHITVLLIKQKLLVSFYKWE